MIKVKSGVTTRDVTTNECPWLEKDIRKGTVVFRFYGQDYGVISPNGVACSFSFEDEELDLGEGIVMTIPPEFFELPKSVVLWD